MYVAVIADETGLAVGFDAWVASRSPALTRFAYLITGNRHEAEDALQSALTSACAKWSRVSRTDDPEAYVRRMVVNAHVSLWRSFRRRQTPVEDVRTTRGSRDMRGSPNGGDPPEESDHAAPIAEADRVWRLCATLPPKQRAAVVLKFYEDMTYPQIAAVLGCTESTARSHIHRALSALRTSIEQEANDD